MPSTIIDENKIFPRIMMLMITILTYQAVHWHMSLPDNYENITQAAGLGSVCMGAFTGCFGIWMSKEAKTVGYQSNVELVFILLVSVAGEADQAEQPIYFRSILFCGNYIADIERTGNEVWVGKNYYQKKKLLIEAHCLPKFSNPQKVQIYE